MASNRTLVEQVSNLGKSLREYVTLRLEYLQLNLSEKTVRLLSFIIKTLLFGAILFVAVVFAVMAFVYWFAGKSGNWPLAFLLGSGIFLFVGLLFYLARRTLIDNPLAGEITEFFDDNGDENKDPEEELK